MERHLLLPLVPFYRPQPPEAEDSDAVPDLLDADSDTDSDTDSEGVPDLLNWDDGHTESDDDEVPPLIGEDSMPPLIKDDSMPALCSDDSDDDVSDDEGPPPLVGEDTDDEEDLPPLERVDEEQRPEQLKSSFSETLRRTLVLGNRLSGLSTYDGFVSEARVRHFFGRVSRSPKETAEAIGNLGRFGISLKENLVTSCNGPVVLCSKANGRVETYVTYPELSGVNKLWRADVFDLPGGPQEAPATGGLKRPVDCTGAGAATNGGQLQGLKCPVGYPGSGATKEAEPQEWSTGLFDCCVDMRTCLLGTFCPSILYGMTSRLVNNGSCVASTMNHLLSLMFGTFLGGCFLCHWGYAPCVAAPLRSAIRNKYGLDSPELFGARNEVERKLADCVMHYWCHACALCQEHREVKLRMEVENEGTYIIPPVIEEMEKPASMAPARSTGIKEGAGGVYYTLLAKAGMQD